MRHQNPSPPTEAAESVGGHAVVPSRKSHDSLTAPTSVPRDLTGCHLGADQDVPFNNHRADFNGREFLVLHGIQIWARVSPSMKKWSIGDGHNSDLNQIPSSQNMERHLSR